MEFNHSPVLLNAVVEHLQIHPGGRYLDGTLGGGGHSAEILDRGGVVFGMDRDPNAIKAAQRRLSSYSEFTAIHGKFGNMEELVQTHAPFDGILLDLGVSSPQLDQPLRGFSVHHDGPVDMRMDPGQDMDASVLLDQLDEASLADILFQYGEEPRSRRIARAIIAGRPWTSTVALAQCVAKASGYRNSRTHPATRTFQALRITVNDELSQLEHGIEAALQLLRKGGRLAVITFHSLEDRLVKRRFAAAAGRGTPRDGYGNPITPPIAKLVVPRGISGKIADPENPRARSSRLRILELIAELQSEAPPT